MTEVPVYVPVPGHLACHGIARGSGIVGTPQKDGRVLIDFEGNLYDAVNLKRYAQRVHHAWGRHSTEYPTVARRSVPAEALVRVGWFSPEALDVDVDPDEELEAALREWLGVEALDYDEMRA